MSRFIAIFFLLPCRPHFLVSISSSLLSHLARTRMMQFTAALSVVPCLYLYDRCMYGDSIGFLHFLSEVGILCSLFLLLSGSGVCFLTLFCFHLKCRSHAEGSDARDGRQGSYSISSEKSPPGLPVLLPLYVSPVIFFS